MAMSRRERYPPRLPGGLLTPRRTQLNLGLRPSIAAHLHLMALRDEATSVTAYATALVTKIVAADMASARKAPAAPDDEGVFG